jgi:hypothetical protein
MTRKQELKLEPGKFYRAKNGAIWCCFRLDPIVTGREHCVARCVELESTRVEYFYADGRYDHAGRREHTLIEEAHE